MIRIPDRLSMLLARNNTLDAAVKTTVDEFTPWLEASGKRPPFFPDYTDHSVDHIEQVLETAVSLIREESWSVLSPADAAVLIIGTILHDSAMHLTPDGFLALVRPGSRWNPVKDFDAKSWSQLWAEFTTEARRFDEQTLQKIFGGVQAVHIPELDDLTWDDRTCLLIGEFIRRHHPRLAHEIARYGVPGPTDDPLRIRANADIAELSGLVARSHGHSARACLPFLKQHFGSRTEPLGVHAVFLIVLLRIADYLQIQAARAPVGRHKVHKIRSPFSATEWHVHASIRDVLDHEEDPEAIYIRANPEDIEAYLRLDGWLRGLQDEMDAAWAVLGEVYSRQGKGMSKLGIRLRRVYSNLDDQNAFAQTVGYLPRHVTFTTSGAGLLTLLVKPLYGSRLHLGIRELVANSVDAVRELQYLQRQGLVPDNLDVPDQAADVVIELDRDVDGTWWLTISDRGIGMTSDVLCNYFLKAGATFRDSGQWRDAYVDDDGKSQILRSGRFGIGVLAAFLLGDKIHVSTRHVSASDTAGLSFSTRLDTDPIEVVPCQRPIGTSIRVRLFNAAVTTLLKALDPAIQKQLGQVGERQFDLWDWYSLRDPAVIRMIRPVSLTLEQKVYIPDANEPLPPEWGRVDVPGFKDVQWTYSPAPGLTCNGIRIRSDPVWKFHLVKSDPTEFPRLSIFDPDGMLPLNLQRDQVNTQRCPFEAELLKSIYSHWIIDGLLSCPDEPPYRAFDPFWRRDIHLPGEDDLGDPFYFWGYMEDGIFPTQAWKLWELNLRSILILPVLQASNEVQGKPYFYAPSFNLQGSVPVLLLPLTGQHADLLLNYEMIEQLEKRNEPTATAELASYLMASLRYYYLNHVGVWLDSQPEKSAKLRFRAKPLGPLSAAYNIKGCTVLMPTDLFTSLGPDAVAGTTIPISYKANLLIFGKRQLMTNGLLNQTSVSKDIAPKFPLIELHLSRKNAHPAETRFARFWKKLVPTPILPFGRSDRNGILATVRANLANSGDF